MEKGSDVFVLRSILGLFVAKDGGVLSQPFFKPPILVASYRDGGNSSLAPKWIDNNQRGAYRLGDS